MIGVLLALAQATLAGPASAVDRWLEREPGLVWTVPLDLSAEDVGLERIRALENQAVVFPTLSRVVFGAPAFVAEGVTALLPDRLSLFERRVYDRGGGEDDLAWRIGRTWIHREISALGRLRDSYIVPMEVEMGLVEPDPDRLERMQRKVLIDSFRRAGRERYAVAHLELDTALEVARSGSWLDYVVLPGLVTLYAARFGVDRRFRLAEEIRLEVSVERASKLKETAEEGEDAVPVASVALNLFRLPVSLIASVDRGVDGVELGFIGVGTDVHAAIEAVLGAKGDHWRRDD